MIDEKNDFKLDRWIEIDATINSIFLHRWGEIKRRINSVLGHLNDSEEIEAHPCMPFLLKQLNIIKSNYDYIDNHSINFKRN
jgi:hypothetical protein